MQPSAASLIDRFGRVHTNLRLSVTDRCNIRCSYCMPAENVVFRPRDELLTFEEIERCVVAAAELGVTKLRLTGGEPLVRTGLATLVHKIVSVPGIEEVAMTTNGMLLAEQAAALKAAGLDRLNISLDTLNEQTFERITRRKGLDRVLEGIFTARQAGFDRIRLNAVAIKGLNESDIVPLGQFARQHGLVLRFIEFMPLNATGEWDMTEVMSGEEIREKLEAAFGPLVAIERLDPSQPATDYQFVDGQGTIGLINPISQPFCGNCNRLRLTAEGQLQNCLFSSRVWDARALLRGDASDGQLRRLMQECVMAKEPGHGIDDEDFVKPQRAMHQIGG